MANGHGGARRGAGRKPGLVGVSRLQQLREEIATAASRTNLIPFIEPAIAELTPLQVMKIGMGIAFQEGRMGDAVAIADKMAPYTHTRLAAVEVTHEVRESPREYTLEELEAQLVIEQAQLISVDYTEEQDGE